MTLSTEIVLREQPLGLSVQEQSSVALGDPAELSSEQLADVVIDGVKKFRRYLPYVIALKERFDIGERDSSNRLKVSIKGCDSWTEFCRIHLDRTPRAISKAIAGTKPKQLKAAKPLTPEPRPAEPVDGELVTEPATPPVEPTPSAPTEPAPAASPTEFVPGASHRLSETHVPGARPSVPPADYNFDFYAVRHKPTGQLIAERNSLSLVSIDDSIDWYAVNEGNTAEQFETDEDGNPADKTEVHRGLIEYLSETVTSLLEQRGSKKQGWRREDFELVKIHAAYTVAPVVLTESPSDPPAPEPTESQTCRTQGFYLLRGGFDGLTLRIEGKQLVFSTRTKAVEYRKAMGLKDYRILTWARAGDCSRAPIVDPEPPTPEPSKPEADE